jgi:6-phosphogluconolactonase
VDVQTARGSASVVLTGGGIGTAVLRALGDSPACAAIDWSRLDVWWGDERFLPAGDPERNETQAREALLDAVPSTRRGCTRCPASDGVDGADAEAAADRYARTLRAAARPEDHQGIPTFDVVMLGIGPTATWRRCSPACRCLRRAAVVAVRGAPKPPPTRISLTLGAIRSGWDVWLLAAGEEKAAAVRNALSGAGEVQVPAAVPAGRQRTLWLVDRAAASRSGRAVADRVALTPVTAALAADAPCPLCTDAPVHRRAPTGRLVPGPRGSRGGLPAGCPLKPLHIGTPRVHRNGAGRAVSARGGRTGVLLAAELGQRLGEDRLAVGVAAALLHVREVRLVRLGARCVRRDVLVLAGGQAAAGAVPDLGGATPGSSAKLGCVSCPLAQ